MVFYFTATGNSLYVAKQLERDPVSIPQIIKEKDLCFQDETIGIVCPVYGSEPPYMVQEFLRKAQFETEYFYVVMTYGCRNGAAAQIIKKIAGENGISLSYTHTIKMVDNFLPGFDMKEEMGADKKVEEQIAVVLRDVKNRKQELEETAPEDMAVYENYLAFTKEHPDLGWKQIQFSTTDRCVGCGLCTKVCPAGCIRLENGRVVHSRNLCQVCMACIHHCPQKAICMNVPEQNPEARFRNEYVEIDEIIKANRQIQGD